MISWRQCQRFVEGLNQVLSRGGVVVHDSITDHSIAVEKGIQKRQQRRTLWIQKGGLNDIIDEMDSRVIIQNLNRLET